MHQQSYKRCRHILNENGRVLEAMAAMSVGIPVDLGEAMTMSHVSQRDDFESNVEEIDFMVEAAISLDGCFHSKVSGSGFGDSPLV